MKNIAPKDKAQLIAESAAEKKGHDIVMMDMTRISTLCDWFVLISATSSRRVNAISKGIQEKLSEERIHPLHIEGKNNPFWVLLDYEDVVAHIFYDERREFYGLERLWSDAPRENFDNKCSEKTSLKRSRQLS